MIPVFLVEDSVLQVGFFRIDLKTSDVSVIPWPLWLSDRIPMRWRSLGFSRYMDGGIWLIECDRGWPDASDRRGRTDPIAIILDRSGEPVRTIPEGWGISSLTGQEARWSDPVSIISVFRQWAIVGGAILRDGEHIGWVDLNRSRLLMDHHPSFLRMGPDGLLLAPSGLAMDPTGKVRMVFNHYDALSAVLSNLWEKGILFFRPVLSVLGWDEEWVWLMVCDSNPVLTPLAIIRTHLLGNRLVDPSLEIFATIRAEARLEGIPMYGALPDGGWAIEIHVVEEDNEKDRDKRGDHQLWFRLPESDEVSVIKSSDTGLLIPWSSVFDFMFHVPPIGLVVIGTDYSGFETRNEKRTVLVVSSGKDVQSIEISKKPLMGDLFRWGWWVRPAPPFIVHQGKVGPEKELTENIAMLSEIRHEILPDVETPQDWSIREIRFVGPSAVIVFVHDRRLDTGVATVRMEKGSIKLIQKVDLPGEFRMVHSHRDHPSEIDLLIETHDGEQTAWWAVRAWEDGGLAVFAVF